MESLPGKRVLEVQRDGHASGGSRDGGCVGPPERAAQASWSP